MQLGRQQDSREGRLGQVDAEQPQHSKKVGSSGGGEELCACAHHTSAASRPTGAPAERASSHVMPDSGLSAKFSMTSGGTTPREVHKNVAEMAGVLRPGALPRDLHET